MNARTQKVCALCGAGMALLFFVGFCLLARFLVPPPPTAGAVEIAHLFNADQQRIRAGMIVVLFGAALMMPWVAAIAVQMRRIEGRHCPLTYTQLGLGIGLMLEFTLPLLLWEAATFRADRDPSQIQLLNDIGWLVYIGLTATGLGQAVVFGIAILTDKRPLPVFPRWMGYFNLWIGLIFVAGTFNVFFKTGPLAWNGVIAWYLVLAAFTLWLPVVTWQLLKAVDRQVAEEAGTPGTVPPTVESLAVELAQLREELRGGTLSSSGAAADGPA